MLTTDDDTLDTLDTINDDDPKTNGVCMTERELVADESQAALIEVHVLCALAIRAIQSFGPPTPERAELPNLLQQVADRFERALVEAGWVDELR